MPLGLGWAHCGRVGVCGRVVFVVGVGAVCRLGRVGPIVGGWVGAVGCVVCRLGRPWARCGLVCGRGVLVGPGREVGLSVGQSVESVDPPPNPSDGHPVGYPKAPPIEKWICLSLLLQQFG